MTVSLRGVIERQLCVLTATCERSDTEIEQAARLPPAIFETANHGVVRILISSGTQHSGRTGHNSQVLKLL